MALWQWSKTANNNANSDPTISIPEGMPPSAVNDSERAVMARIAEWRDDLSGMLLDSGTASAYVVTSNEGLQTPTPTDGTRISFIPANTNAANVTLTADGGTAFPIQSPVGSALGAGVMIALTPYDLVFKTSVSAWILKGLFGITFPTLIPVGGMLDWTLGAVPNSNFALPFGQAISRTTYAALFAGYNALGLPYGAGDGSTTFNIPDGRGNTIIGLDNMGGSAAGRVTAATSLGYTTGEQTHLLSSAEMPSHSHGVTDPGHSHSLSSPVIATSVGGALAGPGGSSGTISSTNSSTTGISIQNAGGGGSHNNLQPLLALNKILRIL